MSQRIFDIRVKGEMSARLRESFEDVEITIDHSVTQLHVVCNDVSALHGILDRIETLGLELLDLRQSDGRSAT
jgi:hypothetical protein